MLILTTQLLQYNVGTDDSTTSVQCWHWPLNNFNTMLILNTQLLQYSVDIDHSTTSIQCWYWPLNYFNTMLILTTQLLQYDVDIDHSTTSIQCWHCRLNDFNTICCRMTIVVRGMTFPKLSCPWVYVSETSMGMWLTGVFLFCRLRGGRCFIMSGVL